MKEKILVSVIFVLCLFQMFNFAFGNNFIVSKNNMSDNNSEIHPLDIKLQNCMAKDYSTAGMNNCVYDSIDDWQKEIDRYSKIIKKELTPEQTVLFEQTQKDWEAYYSKEKTLLYKTIYIKTGTIHTNIAIGEIHALIKNRALFLKNFLSEISE